MSVRANLPLIRSSAAQRATKSSTTAVIASLPPRRSYSVSMATLQLPAADLVADQMSLRRRPNPIRSSVSQPVRHEPVVDQLAILGARGCLRDDVQRDQNRGRAVDLDLGDRRIRECDAAGLGAGMHGVRA